MAEPNDNKNREQRTVNSGFIFSAGGKWIVPMKESMDFVEKNRGNVLEIEVENVDPKTVSEITLNGERFYPRVVTGGQRLRIHHE